MTQENPEVWSSTAKKIGKGLLEIGVNFIRLKPLVSSEDDRGIFKDFREKFPSLPILGLNTFNSKLKVREGTKKSGVTSTQATKTQGGEKRVEMWVPQYKLSLHDFEQVDAYSHYLEEKKNGKLSAKEEEELDKKFKGYALKGLFEEAAGKDEIYTDSSNRTLIIEIDLAEIGDEKELKDKLNKYLKGFEVEDSKYLEEATKRLWDKKKIFNKAHSDMPPMEKDPEKQDIKIKHEGEEILSKQEKSKEGEEILSSKAQAEGEEIVRLRNTSAEHMMLGWMKKQDITSKSLEQLEQKEKEDNEIESPPSTPYHHPTSVKTRS